MSRRDDSPGNRRPANGSSLHDQQAAKRVKQEPLDDEDPDDRQQGNRRNRQEARHSSRLQRQNRQQGRDARGSNGQGSSNGNRSNQERPNGNGGGANPQNGFNLELVKIELRAPFGTPERESEGEQESGEPADNRERWDGRNQNRIIDRGEQRVPLESPEPEVQEGYGYEEPVDQQEVQNGYGYEVAPLQRRRVSETQPEAEPAAPERAELNVNQNARIPGWDNGQQLQVARVLTGNRRQEEPVDRFREEPAVAPQMQRMQQQQQPAVGHQHLAQPAQQEQMRQQLERNIQHQPPQEHRAKTTDWNNEFVRGMEAFNQAKVLRALSILSENDVTEILKYQKPLHAMIHKCGDIQANNDPRAEHQWAICEALVPRILEKCRRSVMRVQSDASLDTLIMLATFHRREKLMEMFLNKAPVFFETNRAGVSVTDSAIRSRKPDVLRMILRRGATFQHLDRRHEVCGPFRNARRFVDHQLDEQTRVEYFRIVEEHHDQLEKMSRLSLRHFEDNFRFHRFGPVVTMPFERTVATRDRPIKQLTFRSPSSEQGEFLLNILPMSYNRDRDEYYAHQEGFQVMRPPVLNDQKCSFAIVGKPFFVDGRPVPLCNRVFLVSENVHQQARNPTDWNRPLVPFEELSEATRRDFRTTFTLDIEVSERQNFDFLAVQIAEFSYR